MRKSSKPKLKRVPLGRPLPLIADDEIIPITSDDIEKARIRAAKLGNAQFNAMVNAEPKPDELFNA